MPTTNQALRGEVRVLIVETRMLTLPAEEITDDVPLFGPGSLGLDSVDVRCNWSWHWTRGSV